MSFPTDTRRNRNGPILQTDLEEQIMALVQQMEDVTEEYEAISEQKVDAEVDYKRDQWKQFLSAEGNIKERESLAGYKTEEQYRQFLRLETLAKVKREKLATIRSALDALRTLSANVRAQT